MRARLLVALLLAPTLAACLAPPAELGPQAVPGPAFSLQAVPPGAFVTEGFYSKVQVPGALEPLPDEVVTIESPVDGVPIEIGVVRPAGPERVPVIATAGPYFRALAAGPLREAIRGNVRSDFLVDNFVPKGYAVAFVPVRGTSGSGGCVGFGGLAERTDLDAAITWLGTQPWSTGRVGMIGLSYTGYTAYEVAAMGNPHLATIVPEAGHGGDFFQTVFRNGTWAPLNFAAAPVFLEVSTLNRAPALGPEILPRIGESATCAETRELAQANAESAAGGGRSAFWDERDVRAEVLANYRGSILIDQGLRDAAGYPHNVYPFTSELERAGIVVKHVLGQWHHQPPDDAVSTEARRGDVVANPTPRWDWAEKLLHWFDYWLKEDSSGDLGPRVEVADSENRWRAEDAWPPADAVPKRFHLAPDGALLPEPASTTSTVLVAADPAWQAPFMKRREVEADCRVCVRFATDPLEEALRFAGLPRFHATVTPTQPGGLLTARLYAEGPDATVPLTWAIMDLRFAAGGEVPADVVPGVPLVARMEFEPADAVVPAGSRLVLVLSQSSGGEGDAFATTWFAPIRPPTPVAVDVGGDASVLEVLAFERAADDPRFFAPPGVDA